MATTVQISRELKEALVKRKIHESESYEELLWDLLEDSMELNEETMKEIELARKDFKKGKFFSLEDVEKEAGL